MNVNQQEHVLSTHIKRFHLIETCGLSSTIASVDIYYFTQHEKNFGAKNRGQNWLSRPMYMCNKYLQNITSITNIFVKILIIIPKLTSACGWVVKLQITNSNKTLSRKLSKSTEICHLHSNLKSTCTYKQTIDCWNQNFYHSP